MSEMARVAKPGGRIILVTWCCRSLAAGETAFSADEQARCCDARQWASLRH